MKATKRKPYIKEVSPTWWTKTPFYRFYMLREATAIPAIWISLLLLYGLGTLSRGFESFSHFLGVLANPFVMFVNIVSLLLVLLHTKTWFELAPKALPLRKGQERPLIFALWGVTLLVSLALIVMAL